MKERSDIEINVDLGEDQIPEDILWRSNQDPSQDWQKSKAMLLSLFDRETKDTLRIDLWTKDMQVIEMDRFFFYTLKAMSDTYMRATNNNELAESMQSFVQHFGEKTGLIK